jgi:hypothetical protein
MPFVDKNQANWHFAQLKQENVARNWFLGKSFPFKNRTLIQKMCCILVCLTKVRQNWISWRERMKEGMIEGEEVPVLSPRISCIFSQIFFVSHRITECLHFLSHAESTDFTESTCFARACHSRCSLHLKGGGDND